MIVNEPFKKYGWFMLYGLVLFASSLPGMMYLPGYPPVLYQEPEMRTILGIMAMIGFIIAMTIDRSEEIRKMATNSPASTTAKIFSKAKSEEESEDSEETIKCRFCGKKYSSDYNGCPYCKKK